MPSVCIAESSSFQVFSLMLIVEIFAVPHQSPIRESSFSTAVDLKTFKDVEVYLVMVRLR